jgi:hypothetical protein
MTVIDKKFLATRLLLRTLNTDHVEITVTSKENDRNRFITQMTVFGELMEHPHCEGALWRVLSEDQRTKIQSYCYFKVEEVTGIFPAAGINDTNKVFIKIDTQ